jgi:hypothetical protein
MLRFRLVVATVVVAVTASCDWVMGPVALPSSPTVRGAGLCVPALDDPVVGTLLGDAADPRLVWLVDNRGQRLEIVWPLGYTVDFRERRVIDDAGIEFARLGSRLVLSHVRVNDYDGTADDPYPVGGIVRERCLR